MAESIIKIFANLVETERQINSNVISAIETEGYSVPKGEFYFLKTRDHQKDLELKNLLITGYNAKIDKYNKLIDSLISELTTNIWIKIDSNAGSFRKTSNNSIEWFTYPDVSFYDSLKAKSKVFEQKRLLEKV